VCHGKRYNRETLEVYRCWEVDRRVLDMMVKAHRFSPSVLDRASSTSWKPARGHIRLGRAPTLSG
jgi:excinuclease UvrABC ATPase subunit